MCTHPRDIFIYRYKDGSIIRSFFRNPKIDLKGIDKIDHYTIGCGKCNECILKKKKEYISGLTQEYLTTKKGLFLTLTYQSNEIINLNKKHIQLFIKRFRKIFNQKIKYFLVGEYGTKSLRPHYHAIIFNIDIKDFKDIHSVPGQTNLKFSYQLQRLRSFGICSIGELNEKTIAYTAGYTLKKQNNYDYEKMGLVKPFILRSHEIGKSFFENNKKNLLDNNGLLINGKLLPITTYEKRYLCGKLLPICDYNYKSPEEFNSYSYELRALIGHYERIKEPAKIYSALKKLNNIEDKKLTRSEKIWLNF